MSVTPQPPWSSRNAGTCNETGGQGVCATRIFNFPHCTTCHSEEHNACLECGKCMGTVADWVFYSDWRDLPHIRRGETRSDRFYCSDACRQRAYRKRKREAL